MRNFSTVLLSILFTICRLSHAAEESFKFLEENEKLTAWKAEVDPLKQEVLLKKLSSCPFKEADADFATLLPASMNLNLSASLPDAKRIECTSYLKDFNEGIEKTRAMKDIVINSPNNFSEQDKINLQNKINNAALATTGLQSMLDAKCGLDNSTTQVSSIANKLTNIIDSTSNTLYLINPVAALIGTATAAASRLVTSMAGWLYGKHQTQIDIQINDSERFVNDLCAFRDLAQKYDKYYIDPFKDNQNAKKELKEKAETWQKSLEESNKQLVCLEKLKSSLDKLQTFALELTAATDKPSSQKQCLNLLNKYIDSKKQRDTNPLQVLAIRYNCSPPIKGNPHSSYCNNLSTVETMTDGDIYEQCEREDFQKMATAKFNNLSDILFRDVQEDMVKRSPITDELQRIREEQENRKRVFEQYNALNSVIESSPLTSVNTSKSMSNLGRNILSFRFDRFAKNTLKSSRDDLSEAKEVLDDLVKKNKKMNQKSIFSWWKKENSEKGDIQKEICDRAPQVQRQLENAYRSSAGLKDICDFMKGAGIPPLKVPGFDYDAYSASISDQKNNLSNRCADIYKEVSSNFAEIKNQMHVASNLGCK